MFSPTTDDLSHSAMYQTKDDHLPLPPSLNITATEDHQNGRMHHHFHDHQYEFANYCSYSSSGCESSPSSYSALLADEIKNNKPMSGSLTQRSLSSHSLPLMMNDNNQMVNVNYQLPAANVMIGGTHRLVDLIDSCSVRRVFSTGNMHSQMQQQHGLSSSKESSSCSSIIEGMMSKACRYSPEEKKERIERYKSKRSHRNFNKKIKYACRKTLADSRPRIRGRFARNSNNNEDESSLHDKWAGNREYEADDHQWENKEDDDDDDNWLDLFNATWLLK